MRGVFINFSQIFLSLSTPNELFQKNTVSRERCSLSLSLFLSRCWKRGNRKHEPRIHFARQRGSWQEGEITDFPYFEEIERWLWNRIAYIQYTQSVEFLCARFHRSRFASVRLFVFSSIKIHLYQSRRKSNRLKRNFTLRRVRFDELSAFIWAAKEVIPVSSHRLFLDNIIVRPKIGSRLTRRQIAGAAACAGRLYRNSLESVAEPVQVQIGGQT